MCDSLLCRPTVTHHTLAPVYVITHKGCFVKVGPTISFSASSAEVLPLHLPPLVQGSLPAVPDCFLLIFAPPILLRAL